MPTYPEGPQPIEILTVLVYRKPAPADEGTFYLDGEDSVICGTCALGSNHMDEVPHFRPVTSFRAPPGESCDQCSFTLEENSDDE